MRALVTGGAGFIGSNLVDALVARGDEVVVLDNFSSGRREHLAGADVVEGDLRDPDTVRRAATGVDVVFHQGAIPSVMASVDDPLTVNAVNVEGTVSVLVAALAEEARRVVFASSCAVYGDAPEGSSAEDLRPAPISPYAVSKLAGEGYCHAFWEVHGLETVSLRYFNVFGPRQDPASDYAAVVPRFVTRLLQGEPPMIEGDGEQSRDFVYVGDVVRANLLAADVDGIGGEVVNIASGYSRTVNELAATLARIIGSSVEPIHVDPREGDIRESAADIGKAQELLGLEPQNSFESGLTSTVDLFREAA